MNIHHPDPEGGRRLHGGRHGVGDVVELEVEEHRPAERHDLLVTVQYEASRAGLDPLGSTGSLPA